MNPKWVPQSKTIIANVLAIATVVLGSPEMLDVLPEMRPQTVTAILGIVNIALRLVTTQPVTFRKTR